MNTKFQEVLEKIESWECREGDSFRNDVPRYGGINTIKKKRKIPERVLLRVSISIEGQSEPVAGTLIFGKFWERGLTSLYVDDAGKEIGPVYLKIE